MFINTLKKRGAANMKFRSLHLSLDLRAGSSQDALFGQAVRFQPLEVLKRKSDAEMIRKSKQEFSIPSAQPSHANRHRDASRKWGP
jgi:hypothetical protein